MTRMIAGPVAGRLLAELGAEVTRVIHSSLPDASFFGPEYNVNKRSIFINMKTPEGQKQISHLLETADIFLQSKFALSVAITS
jgi:crotonobetainyl-CoA:carnitine CoA-transferase CaiB-like acyl-CoA transferase